MRIGLVDGEFIINPTRSQVAEGDLDLVLASRRDAVVMLEAGAKEVSEGQILDALEFRPADDRSASSICSNASTTSCSPRSDPSSPTRSIRPSRRRSKSVSGAAIKEALGIADKIPASATPWRTFATRCSDALDEEEAEHRDDYKESYYGLIKKITRTGVLEGPGAQRRTRLRRGGVRSTARSE